MYVYSELGPCDAVVLNPHLGGKVIEINAYAVCAIIDHTISVASDILNEVRNNSRVGRRVVDVNAATIVEQQAAAQDGVFLDTTICKCPDSISPRVVDAIIHYGRA